MVGNIASLVEAVTLLLCINWLYGKRLKLDIGAVLTMAINIVMLQMQREGIISRWSSIVFYVLIVGYCMLELGYRNIRELIINFLLCMTLQVILQAASFMLLQIIGVLDGAYGAKDNLMVLLVSLVLTCLISIHGTLHKISLFMQQKLPIIRIIMVVALVLIGYMLVITKAYGELLPQHYVVITISLVLLCALTYLWQRTQSKVKEQNQELLLHQQYDESYNELITSIRGKQHDFSNHLNSIEGMGLMYKDHDELVKKQTDYISSLREENKYSRLLSISDSAIVGFLFTKFKQIEEQGVRVDFQLKVADMNCKVPDYKIVELVGNLLDNARDAVVKGDKEKVIHVRAENREDEILFSVYNQCEYVNQAQIEKMFRRGVSSKGENRGQGLANVKQICKEYHCDIQVENRKEEEKNYIQFTLHLRK